MTGHDDQVWRVEDDSASVSDVWNDPVVAGMFDASRHLLTATGLFDPEYYLSQQPDLSSSGEDAFAHFFLRGFQQGLLPNILFDPVWYLSRNEDVSRQGTQPLLHYVLYGERLGLKPSPLFDPGWYRGHYNIGADENALVHFLRNRSGDVNPNPLFDRNYYLATYPDVAQSSLAPIDHYLRFGFTHGWNPSAKFNARFYTQRYLKGDRSRNPLAHYLENAHLPGIHATPPDHEVTVAAEVRQHTKPGKAFEDVQPLARSVPRKAKLLAYYLPQFHAIPENDRWWGKGFTEWTNIGRGLPRFEGHYQPRLPRDLGFYSLDDTRVMEKQVRLALEAGIYGFVYYYYWFNQRRLLEKPIEAMLANRKIDMPFCLMWANENWTRRWDGMESEVLIAQDYRAEDQIALMADLARHFADPRYIRIEGRPIFMIYRAGLIPDTLRTIATWRENLRNRHGEDPIMVMAQSFTDIDPRGLGFDGAIEFPPHKIVRGLKRLNDDVVLLDDTFSGDIYAYDDVVERSLGETPPPFPLIRTAAPGWDNDARRQGSGLVISGSTPEKYERWLAGLVERARKHPFFGETFVGINAWNEWCEGAYLEPDLHFGGAYLNATARAVAGVRAESRRQTILLVGHDAFPGGAQHLLLNIGRKFVELHGFDVEFLLLGGGALEEAYRAVAPTTIASQPEDVAGHLASLRLRDVSAAICNTCATGHVVTALKLLNLRVVLLVHELPGLLRDKQLETHARSGIGAADCAVFPADHVCRNLLDHLGIEADSRMLVRPQGCYTVLADNREAALALRARLGIGPGEKLVIGVGYGDHRKGVDLFHACWEALERRRHEGDVPAAVHFCWVGAMDDDMAAWLQTQHAEGRRGNTFSLAGYQSDVAPYFRAADAFLLASREDPFPTVALEALSTGIEILAFADTGGIAELLSEHQLGHLAEIENVPMMVDLLQKALFQPPDPERRARAVQLIAEEFRFDDYTRDLMVLARPDLPRISVVIPNYNYAQHLPARLRSIFEQSHPVTDIIVLDDSSSDNSVDVVFDVAEKSSRDIQLVINDENSGSVFAQWQLGTELAGGDYLWIAEADDLSRTGFLDSLATMLHANEDIVLAFSGSCAISGSGELLYDSYQSYYNTVEAGGLAATQIFDGADFARRLLSVKNVILNVSSVLWRRSALIEGLGRLSGELRDFRMAGDWRLYLELLARPNAKIAFVTLPLNIHRRHEESLTHTLEPDRHIEEVARCHAAARALFEIPMATVGRQEQYLGELRSQLGRSGA